MTRFPHFFGTQLKGLLYVRVPLPQSRVGRLMAAFSAFGIVGLGYLGGAAVMFFHLPPCGFLNKAFAGANAWYERCRPVGPFLSGGRGAAAAQVTVDQAEKTSDGFTLYTLNDGARATLLDMRATVVHRWE